VTDEETPIFERGDVVYGDDPFNAPTVKYDANTMTLFDNNTVSLATIDSRVRCELVLPDDENGYQYQYLNSDE
jgi:hypothetical protein